MCVAVIQSKGVSKAAARRRSKEVAREAIDNPAEAPTEVASSAAEEK